MNEPNEEDVVEETGDRFNVAESEADAGILNGNNQEDPGDADHGDMGENIQENAQENDAVPTEPPDEEPPDEVPPDEEPADEEPADEELADEELADEEPPDEESPDEEPPDGESAHEEPSDEEQGIAQPSNEDEKAEIDDQGDENEDWGDNDEDAANKEGQLVVIEKEDSKAGEEILTIIKVPPSEMIEEKQIKVPEMLPFFAAKEADIEGEIPKLLMVDMQCGNASTVANGIKKLARLCHSAEKVEKQKEALQMGGHAVLISTMKRWPSTLKIQANACVCMQNMMSNYPEAKQAFAMIGGMEAVIITMCNFPQSAQIQNFGCGALNNYISGSDEKAKQIAERFVNKLEGIEILLFVMKEFPRNASLQERVCHILLSLCTFEDCKNSVRRRGAISSVATTIDTHIDNDGIQKWGNEFMKKFFC